MITGYSIEHVLPHAHPMILLNEFIEADSAHALCRVQISPQSPFYDAALAGVPSYVGLEYMAQTIAAYAGANNLADGDKVQIGFFLGCRKYVPSTTVFAVGTELTVRATQMVTDSSGLSVFDCQIYQQHQLLVDAKLNVFQPDDHRSWLTE
ncbi:Predicted 3-hydroxylacyl-ACP dehydratase, HotDog domain [Rheinheimera pacifica]|uniref:Predicted 3-hydroxylacyl-ACP dehydratase, HotDog domain n=1 Tax=Rheinheimera pacifica TaxID=173990 RepID=A0A1H6JZZ7_9GAMM|nr:3-hydroxylacyl-ACP dehydratase [Rheinheimera pacifica]SEH66219.1 Predicted 3-hydroxylacyl-ACP dehydratase, HotDog domain [Rheinheimera pacifica]